MSKHYRNYIGITTSDNYNKRKTLGGSANLFDTNLDIIESFITGGNRTEPGNSYVYNVFSTPGTLVVSAPPGGLNVDILLVAGGGAGGTGYYGGGGGAGGVIYYPNYNLQAGLHPVSIGPGGATSGASGQPSTYNQPSDPLVALGGGGGGPRYGVAQPGGSGGGVGMGGGAGLGIQPTSPTIPANSRTYGYGQPGGPDAYGAGGGGATESGEPGPLAGGGDGYNAGTTFAGPLLGLPALTTNGYFGGGGAGGVYPSSSNPGGLGGGANAPSGIGLQNSGGGGGGHTGPGGAGGAGGSGICVFRYPNTLL